MSTQDTEESLRAEAAGLLQQAVQDWQALHAGGPIQLRFYEYKMAYTQWLASPGELGVAWGLIVNAFGGDGSRGSALWKRHARDWERRWRLFESGA